MVKDTRKRRRQRPRSDNSEISTTPPKGPRYILVVLIVVGSGLLFALLGLGKDIEAAVTLGVVGLILGSIGGAAILLGESLPARRGTKQAFRNYHGGNDMPDIDDINK